MQKEKEHVALISVLASGGLAIVKFVIGFMTGSIGLISEGVHSSSDFVATLITWWAVRVSHKPADDDHHFGHGKMESMAALFQVVLLFGAAGWIAYEAIKRLLGESHVIEGAWMAIAVLVGSIIVDFWRVRALRKVAKATGSPALEADALHFLSDMLSSGVVLIGMIFVAFGQMSADAVAALIVACFIIFAAFKLGRQTFDTLVDTAPEGASRAIAAHVERIPEVLAVERTRVRSAGATLFVELAVAVSRSLPLDHVSALNAQIVETVQNEFPNAEVIVVAEPRAVDDEAIETHLRVIAANLGAAIHRLTIQRVAGRLSISVDIEVQADLSVDQAHDAASELEAAIRKELGDDIEIDTHIEPMAANWLSGKEIPDERYRTLKDSLIASADEGGVVRDVHNVRIRSTELGLIMNFHCRLPPDMLVSDAHTAVDEVERRVRSLHPDVVRVVGHAEPQRAI
ncbi:Cation diffusion facilitator family transporter [Candidatus Filomicrobium marinum]|uniref:Cation diffusion facilitator family transporter n=2 Tax=Filomicrobium TaxID=119044 RepID=A0A0D6JGK2_9HYPH|nr:MULTISPECIES: cation-efflux pump [Filomicrobium]CFX28486.1 Cation diffusion facilitator family transporter [Candidatus Filomicrobium marinum]CPR19698.1 Cation diffusion facilitator family transporter [Candidatus Filomicrobium marinum]SDO02800.1 cation diffusion facilitator family transporter [Filomicrobium insigne]